MFEDQIASNGWFGEVLRGSCRPVVVAPFFSGWQGLVHVGDCLVLGALLIELDCSTLLVRTSTVVIL
ncbi:uncharacterized protein G2W53_026394 [Senna tora]|uniref:Uncharacterized protein n=1 Tax=Senna tora TaxID=362788 RepID=A0A834WL69_9FABA|nr:uncharacterized protein G2W53_026394 [Senna tora]